MAAPSSRARISWQMATKLGGSMITTPRRRTRRSIRARPTDQISRRATNFPVVVPKIGAPRSGPEILECSSLRIYSRIPRSLLVIRPVIAQPTGVMATCHEIPTRRGLRAPGATIRSFRIRRSLPVIPGRAATTDSGGQPRFWAASP